MKLIPRTIAALLAFSPLYASAAYEVSINAPLGLQSLLEDNLDLVRYKDRADLSKDQFDYLVATAAEQTNKLLATEGYFSADTEVSLDQGTDAVQVMLRVTPNKRTIVSKANIVVQGAIGQDTPRLARRISTLWTLKEGQPFTQTDWDDAKDGLLNRMQDNRYAAARLLYSRANIDPATAQANLQAEYDSGPSFTLGKLAITGLQRYPRSIIDNVNPLVIGETYSVSRLQALQQQIQNTPYFNNVIVSIDNDPAHAEKTPVKVHVTEYQTQRFRYGIGFATDTGTQTEGRYSHYNVFNKAWVFDTQAKLEQRRQFGSLSLAMPPDNRSYVHSVTLATDRTTLQGADMRSQRLRIERARTREFYDTSFSLTFYSDELHSNDGAQLPTDTVTLPGKHRALVPGFQWSRRQVDNPIFPRNGHLLTTEAGFAVKGALTDQTFSRLYVRYKHFFSLSRNDVMILHSQFGGVLTDGRATSVPASLLFRAGGSDSVRGYSYQSIGNRQGGTVYPTKYMAILSGEYQHWFSDNWGGAVFYDIGTAADNWTEKELYKGTGVGARWKSPVGIVQIDMAYGLKNKSFRPHISLGIAF